MTAADAAKSWLVRAEEIEAEYRARPSDPAVHDEANVCARGINALLENRGRELSEEYIDVLGQTVDRMAHVANETLANVMKSPARAFLESLSDSYDETVNQIKGGVTAGAKKLEDFGKLILIILVVFLVASLFVRR